MGVIQEFKEFALKGNMVDMAVGIVIGGAFGTVVKSLVDDVITPPLGMLTENIRFEQLGYPLRGELGDPDAVVIKYGLFINAMISFLLVALAIFMVVKIMNRVREEFEQAEETPAPTTKKCDQCKLEIPLDALRCGHCTSVVTP